jgi:hypothetical protein
MVNYQKLFSRCFRVVSNIELERGGGGGGGGGGGCDEVCFIDVH